MPNTMFIMGVSAETHLRRRPPRKMSDESNATPKNNNPKDPDPSKLAILRTFDTPAMQVHTIQLEGPS